MCFGSVVKSVALVSMGSCGYMGSRKTVNSVFRLLSFRASLCLLQMALGIARVAEILMVRCFLRTVITLVQKCFGTL